MTLVLENGSGVGGGNAYVDNAFVTAYLTDRNRVTENTWSSASAAEQDTYCIAATDYFEQRFRMRLKGAKEFMNITQARAVLTFTAQPLDTETVTIGANTYRFVTALAQAGDVLIDTSKLSQTILNLIDAINGNSLQSGVTYHAGTVTNDDVSGVDFYGFTMMVVADDAGPDANFLATTTTVTGATWNFTTLNGGSDLVIPQPLSFPRVALVDADGLSIYGIPERLKFGISEYAVRARAATLLPDPTVDATGRTVTRLKEKIGPIETETQYMDTSVISNLLRPYPAADRFFVEFLKSGNRVIRG